MRNVGSARMIYDTGNGQRTHTRTVAQCTKWQMGFLRTFSKRLSNRLRGVKNKEMLGICFQTTSKALHFVLNLEAPISS